LKRFFPSWLVGAQITRAAPEMAIKNAPASAGVSRAALGREFYKKQ